MIEKIKLLLGITKNDKDDLLELLIEMAEKEVHQITKLDNIDCLENIVIKMVVFNYNRLGTEGLESESYNGATYSYSPTYPDDILQELKKYRKLKILW